MSLIDRGKVMNDYLENLGRADSYKAKYEALVKAVDAAVDAEPVRHGRLVSTGSDELYCEWGDCTVCGFDNRIDAKFCNNCGAKIEGIVPK